jgi:hypothetical protein
MGIRCIVFGYGQNNFKRKRETVSRNRAQLKAPSAGDRGRDRKRAFLFFPAADDRGYSRDPLRHHVKRRRGL